MVIPHYRTLLPHCFNVIKYCQKCRMDSKFCGYIVTTTPTYKIVLHNTIQTSQRGIISLPTNQQIRTNKQLNLKEAEHVGRRMPVFKCSCGENILIVPDLAAMNRAIENHINEHLRKTGQIITEDQLSHSILKVLASHCQTH